MKRQAKSSERAALQRQVIIINRPFVSPQKRCDQCVEASGMITPDEAAALSNVSTRTIYRWLESDSIHFSETPSSGLLICLQTLVKNISLPVPIPRRIRALRDEGLINPDRGY